MRKYGEDQSLCQHLASRRREHHCFFFHSRLSQGIAERLLSAAAKAFPGLNVDDIQSNFLVRKSAHFLTYLILSVLTMNALRRSDIKGGRQITIAIGICVLYAISDEVHQLFVPGRSGQLKDVLLDSGGAIVGAALYRLSGGRG